ncbi:Asp23/Gls24 family envelope stress response protein [Peptoniphilus equinus]|uniref:Asp23/Gls24 family envelope stress response protein n=1 Tax=Peptoniphilus equinus TaxID=3016343 RepID=A0ABY7QVY5_9FIRM|nr:Asp23/Gls24 family envelope stress response protein [Peptoniphilus equinus]WBW50591.1 Asp23/Gls24 family envelope stress response protein [Peptoniphilus equinus]
MSEKYLVESGSTGDVKISEDVIATISILAAETVEGVVKTQSGLKSQAMDIIGRAMARGIKVSVGEAEAVIDLHITVEYGLNIVDIATKVQDKVKDAVENMTGLTVVETNVHVSGIAVPDRKVKN